ncbi:tRNA/rRNA methyltransferase [Shimwellia pseudoproteus]|uniref:tRNA/rRNA methyltransferase n=1 Tax=Shimwellia pseudoproteus TaxID=570012 RepID=UPI0018EC4029|nr:tRNA/rRNA methyltransferase [Shimwellia pseudoproteus]MBJ3816578.1 tRNA/rRNA methyltransferase [Shimwellia pseudoproteus]
MNDELKGKSGKVKVMYVRGDDESEKRGQNPRTGKGGGRNAPRQEGGRRGSRDDKATTAGRDRKRDASQREPSPRDASPWRTVSRAPGEESSTTPDHGGISGKSYIDPEVLRRQRAEETRVYGENACQSLFRNRPESIVRAWFIQSVTPRFKEALRWMAANRKAYHVVDDAELAKASGTERHGGVCFLIKKRNGMAVEQWISTAAADDCVLALEDIGNPHNVGAMVRTCAHFGARGVLVPDAAVLESGAAVRTAEGGAEHVQAITGSSFDDALDQFRDAGYTVVSTVTDKGKPLFNTELPHKMVLVPGFERGEGESGVAGRGDIEISIDGSGDVDGLNVSVATGVVMAEWWRQHKA